MPHRWGVLQHPKMDHFQQPNRTASSLLLAAQAAANHWTMHLRWVPRATSIAWQALRSPQRHARHFGLPVLNTLPGHLPVGAEIGCCHCPLPACTCRTWLLQPDIPQHPQSLPTAHTLVPIRANTKWPSSPAPLVAGNEQKVAGPTMLLLQAPLHYSRAALHVEKLSRKCGTRARPFAEAGLGNAMRKLCAALPTGAGPCRTVFVLTAKALLHSLHLHLKLQRCRSRAWWPMPAEARRTKQSARASRTARADATREVHGGRGSARSASASTKPGPSMTFERTTRRWLQSAASTPQLRGAIRLHGHDGRDARIASRAPPCGAHGPSRPQAFATVPVARRPSTCFHSRPTLTDANAQAASAGLWAGIPMPLNPRPQRRPRLIAHRLPLPVQQLQHTTARAPAVVPWHSPWLSTSTAPQTPIPPVASRAMVARHLPPHVLTHDLLAAEPAPCERA
mmetsp:Transcript_75385/g.243875  ORF Transcript_75385/g.243875 Transcript_75385/m.243875 type:complete len:452 (-) Transcript_75385:164-1519(-)